MVLSYSDHDGCPAQPPYCRCKNDQTPHFQKKGIYVRKMAQAVARFFLCTTCKTHITMLPSSCVPYKQYPADEVEYCMDTAVCGRRPVDIERDDGNQGASRGTIKRWLDEWIINSTHLASVASEKLSRIVSGGARAIYQALSGRYGGRAFFRALQPDLCRAYPPMGVFRPLIRLS